MKHLSYFIITILVLTSYCGFSQTNTKTGIITSVKPHFANSYEITIDNEHLILIKNLSESNIKKPFIVNNQYQDLVISENGVYVLNPKYKNKKMTITYALNGKGWKCIEKIKAHKK